MKILAICGSPRKGNTYSVLNAIKENFPGTDYKVIMLKDLDFEMCKGCYSCVTLGEESCPVKDDRNMILKEMMDADGVIFSSPAYSHMVSALMKNYFDRFGYLAHRPQFFDKYSMSLTTGSGYGTEFAARYMDKMSKVFGFNLAPSLELQFQPGKNPKSQMKENNVKITTAFKAFLALIQEGTKDKPTLNQMVPFGIFKAISLVARDVMPADYEYYKDRKDFYYDAKIPFLKKWIAKKVVNKEVDKILINNKS